MMSESNGTAFTDSRLLQVSQMLVESRDLLAQVLDELDIDSPYGRDLVKAYSLTAQGHATLFKVVKA